MVGSRWHRPGAKSFFRRGTPSWRSAVVPGKTAMKKWFKRVLIGSLGLVLAGWLLSLWLLQTWTAKPPPLPPNTKIMQLKSQEREGKIWLGQSWVGRREGLLVINLKGTPFEMGYAN